MARDTSGGTFVCAGGAMCFRSDTPDASGGILFSGLSEKSMQKRDAGVRNSAVAPEKALCFCVPFTDSAVRKERPSGGRPIGFPERTMRRASRFVRAR